MRYTSFIKRQAKRFYGASAGSVAIICSLLAVPLIMGAGVAIDLIRSNDARQKIQWALNAGILAAASTGNLSDVEREEIARQTFAANIDPATKLNLVPTVSISSDAVSMSVSFPTAFMQAAGINSMGIESAATVNLSQIKKAEIALVLSHSGSMSHATKGWHKYKIMHNAAIQMVDDMTQEGTSDQIRFGLVPNARPVSNDRDAIVAELKNNRSYARMNVAAGFSSGWELVAPNGQFGDVAEYNDDSTIKAIVLLTDGRQTEPSLGTGGLHKVAHGESNLEKLCASAKAKNVTVVTVAFDLQHQITEDRLRNCSSDPDRFFFTVNDRPELVSAFEEIKNQLQLAIYIDR